MDYVVLSGIPPKHQTSEINEVNRTFVPVLATVVSKRVQIQNKYKIHRIERRHRKTDSNKYNFYQRSLSCFKNSETSLYLVL